MSYRLGVDVGATFTDLLLINEAAAEALREEMRAARGNHIPLFDKGGALSELIARYEEETGLAPPTPPVFPDWVQKDRAAE
ncbi:MAG: hypothetical protein V3T62_05910 [Alphaproteobacteria bacterium]